MATWQPDPSFYPSPRMAAKAPEEKLAYVAAFDPDRKKPDAIAVVDVDPRSTSYSRIVGQVDMPNAGDELHHFGCKRKAGTRSAPPSKLMSWILTG